MYSMLQLHIRRSKMIFLVLFTNFQIFSTYIYCILDSFSSTMDSGSYVMDSATLLAPPPRFPFTMTTSRHSLPNLDPNDMVVSQVSTYFILYLRYLCIYISMLFFHQSKQKFRELMFEMHYLKVTRKIKQNCATDCKVICLGVLKFGQVWCTMN